MTTKVKYLAIAEHALYSSSPIYLTTDHPRKELLERLNAKRADKIYVDDTNGQAAHVGYIIAGVWYTLYQVAGRGPTAKEGTK